MVRGRAALEADLSETFPHCANQRPLLRLGSEAGIVVGSYAVRPYLEAAWAMGAMRQQFLEGAEQREPYLIVRLQRNLLDGVRGAEHKSGRETGTVLANRLAAPRGNLCRHFLRGCVFLRAALVYFPDHGWDSTLLSRSLILTAVMS